MCVMRVCHTRSTGQACLPSVLIGPSRFSVCLLVCALQYMPCFPHCIWIWNPLYSQGDLPDTLLSLTKGDTVSHRTNSCLHLPLHSPSPPPPVLFHNPSPFLPRTCCMCCLQRKLPRLIPHDPLSASHQRDPTSPSPSQPPSRPPPVHHHASCWPHGLLPFHGRRVCKEQHACCLPICCSIGGRRRRRG